METAPVTHWIGSWVGLRAGLDAMVSLSEEFHVCCFSLLASLRFSVQISWPSKGDGTAKILIILKNM
jgi:hypothetical protein